MKSFLLPIFLFAFVTGVFCQHVSEITDPDSVLAWLKSGNDSFVKGEFDVLGVDSSLRIELSKAQHPKAVILTCADSRVSPELIFDKGLGDLFVIRVAGNISDDAVVGSIEYAVEHLHTSLVVVMGHQNCGAIGAATADLQDSKNEIDNHIRILTDKIQQAIVTVNLNEKDPTQKALLSNVIFTVSSLKESRPVLSEAVKKGKLKITGAVYDLSTGKVAWLKN
jgi:carbonic anhydrase